MIHPCALDAIQTGDLFPRPLATTTGALAVHGNVPFLPAARAGRCRAATRAIACCNSSGSSGVCCVPGERDVRNDSSVDGQRRFVFARRRLLVRTGPYPPAWFQQGTEMDQSGWNHGLSVGWKPSSSTKGPYDKYVLEPAPISVVIHPK
jgi:hypothetical protein